MERIILPVRTVTRRRWLAALVGGLVILVAALWAADVILVRVMSARLFSSWRAVVLTRQNIRDFQSTGVGSQLRAEWTLFQEEGPNGVRHRLQPNAYRALKLDSWDGQKRYLYARGFWRDVTTGPARETTVGGAKRVDQIDGALRYLRSAIRCEPMNSAYRQTLAEVLLAVDPAINRSEARRLVEDAPPRNGWGELRTADLMSAFDAPAEAPRTVLAHYLAALDLSTDYSGLVDMHALEAGEANPQPMTPRIVGLALDGIIRGFGKYDAGTWRDAAEFKNLTPSVHFLVAQYLAAAHDTPGAQRELQAVVDSAQDRFNAEKRLSLVRFVFEVANPLMKPDASRRYISREDLALAGSVLRGLNQPERAVKFYEDLVARHPGWVPAYVGLAQALVDRAAEMKSAADRMSDRATADAFARKAQDLIAQADRKLTTALELDPKSSEALAVRRALSGRGVGTP